MEGGLMLGFKNWLKNAVIRWLKIDMPGFIGVCSWCGLSIFSNIEYMVVLRTGWGRQRIALACTGCGSKRKTVKRVMKHKEFKPARRFQSRVAPVIEIGQAR
jgi:hypothetical protein